MIIGFKRLSENATLPTKANPSDSGWDLYAAEDYVIAPRETIVIKTDIAVQLLEGFGATVRPRSGVTSKTKLRVQLGTIDSAYTGNIGIIVDNVGDDELSVPKGFKLAQLVLERIYDAEATEIFELEETERGSNGFGSSGYGVNK